ncbi:MAG: hypothetical protein IPK07_09155 [Deltaproteobacteria bacterium]|nr:hypothetical protein [Deltaproteobacteria bacterium]
MNDGDATEVHLAHGGRERRVLVHAPAGVGQAGPAPLVLAFHGGLGTAKAMRRQSLLDRVADRERFIVAYPEGIGRFRDRMLTWNAGSCCGYAMRMNSDDVGFTLAILDEVARRWSVDAARTYAVGFSNGGMFSYRLACEVPGAVRRGRRGERDPDGRWPRAAAPHARDPRPRPRRSQRLVRGRDRREPVLAHRLPARRGNPRVVGAGEPL